MFNFLSSKDKRETKPAGPAFIVLNILRTCNIIALLDVVVASWIMLVMTVKTSNFFFFDGVSHFITSTISIFLIISELSLFKPYFTQHWPLLSPTSSFLFLGSAMIAVGFNVLGNLNKEATSIAELGLPMWRVVISSGILSAVFGFFAIFANYWYRTPTQTVRQLRSRYLTDSLPITNYLRPLSLNGTTFNASEPMTRREKFMSKLPFSHKRESRQAGGRFPVISGPMVGDHKEFDVEKMSTSSYGAGDDREVLEDRNELARPPIALHPFHRRGDSGDRYSASQYSVATHGPF